MNTVTHQASLLQYFTTGDGVRIAYRLEGPVGKPVLALSNSIATTLHMWDDQIPVFTQHFRVLRFDTRGHGASGAPAGDYSIDRMGHDLIELLDHLQLEKVHFLGLSLGGFIGQWLAIHAGHHVDKLILVNTSPYLAPHNTWNELIKSLRTEGNMQPFGEMFIRNWFPENYQHQHPAVIATFKAMVLTTDPQGLAGSFAAVRDGDFRKTNALITNPTLVIGGLYDGVTLPTHSEDIATTIPKAKLLLLPVVHMSNVESAEPFNKAVMDFLVG
ncbi:alpha/beta fold hydrolase [Paraflavitalea sp. CAU 1676]|uniref:alpha/beta fold hydrolase n=1 Tax=Paraflavitalea sp. CAU 1676 TaxID=3032598 RepID=UPI0023DC95DB|nr:alpha/beta fold hydrolase [Paraflavitalea sp. CAU 1676]MDF2193762.1 alpha/beta fold hydrolase [Paraflavitalea sp. CAU 1676]